MKTDPAQSGNAPEQTRSVERSAIVLVARRDEPLRSDATDLSNVVPFTRPHRHAGQAELPLPTISAAQRAAPVAGFGTGRRAALIIGSMALHAALLGLFWHETPPLASIGIEAVTVEFTLGGTTAAGVAPMPGEQEAQAVPPSEERAVEEPVATEQSPVATVMPQEVPVAAQETAPEVKPQDIQTTEVRPQDRPPEVVESTTPEPAEIAPTERPLEPKLEEAPRPPPAVTAQPAPERKRLDAPTEEKAKPAETKQRVAAAPTDGASGVGRGRSNLDANYNGMVGAHLTRHKQYPTDARAAGAQGIATVSFGLDGSGRVTSVSLARTSGNASIDREVLAMVRRASPFPRPPDGRGRNYTVPVRFNLH